MEKQHAFANVARACAVYNGTLEAHQTLQDSLALLAAELGITNDSLAAAAVRVEAETEPSPNRAQRGFWRRRSTKAAPRKATRTPRKGR